ncbi:MAG: universal stress protein [Thermoplasmata archaeon]|nr:MAG: universal stress protein [Thermoplasmata archaeon]HEC89620.1 universal stress protein [Thermoplasmatales archaeon]
MIKKIVIPTDGYGLEDHVIRYLARAFPFADFHIISVINTFQRGVQLTNLLYKEMKEGAEKAVEHGRAILEEEGIHNAKTRISEGLPSKMIVDYANRRDADLIALRVYSRKATVSAQRMGSTVIGVLKRSNIPVLTLAEDCERFPIKHILFATDGTRKAETAKNFAILLSSVFKANLEVLHVIEDSDGKHAERIIENVEWKSSFMNVDVKKSIERGDVVEKILEHAEDNDLIIMGTGRKFLLWHFVGHVTRAVCTHSPVPVIIVRSIKKRWIKRISRRY